MNKQDDILKEARSEFEERFGKGWGVSTEDDRKIIYHFLETQIKEAVEAEKKRVIKETNDALVDLGMPIKKVDKVLLRVLHKLSQQEGVGSKIKRLRKEQIERLTGLIPLVALHEKKINLKALKKYLEIIEEGNKKRLFLVDYDTGENILEIENGK